VREFTMVNTHNFIVREEESGVYRASDSVGDEGGFVDGFHGGFGDFKHEGPVGAFFGRGGGGFVAVGELEGGETGGGLGLVVGGVVGENGSSVEGTVGFGEVELPLVLLKKEE
jgi:hypothetical protein